MAEHTNSGHSIDLEHYFRLLLRQKWFLILPACLGVVAMLGYGLTLNNLYKASTTILVEPQGIPADFFKSTMPYGPETYVRSLVEQIKSQSSLETVIKKFNLYPEMRAQKSMEEVVAVMRDRIEIENRGNQTFSISFVGQHPETVQQVAEELTQMFIDQNLHYRLVRSQQNVDFMESQALKLRNEVSEQEKRIQMFKSSNLEMLPEQRLSTQTQLNAAQQRLQSNAESLTRAQAQVVALNARIAMMGYSQGGSVTSSGAPVSRMSPGEVKLAHAREELSVLATRLSPKHPDYIAKEREVEALAAQVAAQPAAGPSVVRLRPRAPNPEALKASEEIKLAQADVKRLEDEQKSLKEQIGVLNQRLENTPRVELDLSELTKGLQVMRDQADAFQKKATDAAASLALEKASQGSQFRSLDHARLPSKPISPNRPLMVAVGGGVGLLLGLMLIVGFDLLFRPFLDEQDLARFTGCQVLVSIPHVGPFPSEWQRFRGQVTNLVGYLLGSLSFGEEDYVPEGIAADSGTDWSSDSPTVAGVGQRPDPMPPRGGHTAASSPFASPDRSERPIITRAATRATLEFAPGGRPEGNGRMVYSSSSKGEVTGQGRHEDPDSIRVTRPIEVTVLETPRWERGGQEAALSRDTQRFPVIRVGERPMMAVQTREPVALGANWGNPERYVITARPVRTAADADETVKELYRRAPWNGGKES